MFKKGDAVTIVASWDSTGTVYVRHFIVRSWGVKQASLIRTDDGSNAKFRVYTPRASRLQGAHSVYIMPTADYSEALALDLAAKFIADEHKRAADRWNRAQETGVWLEFERSIWERHNSIAWAPTVKVGG